MQDIRIKDITNTSTAPASDDYIPTDGNSAGTRKLSVYNIPVNTAILAALTANTLVYVNGSKVTSSVSLSSNLSLSGATLDLANSIALSGGATFAGDVGIGTPTPLSPLDIRGSTTPGANLVGIGSDASKSALLVRSSGTGAGSFDADSGTGVLNIGASPTGATQYSIFARGGAIFAEVLGNVGIGTMTPSAKLAINGGIHVGGDSDPGDNNLLVDGTATMSGTLTTQAARIVHTKIVTSTYAVDTTTPDEIIIGNHASVAFTITMIAASSNTGRKIVIKNKGIAVVTVDATSMGQIDGQNTISLSQYQSIESVSDGATWNLI